MVYYGFRVSVQNIHFLNKQIHKNNKHSKHKICVRLTCSIRLSWCLNSLKSVMLVALSRPSDNEVHAIRNCDPKCSLLETYLIAVVAVARTLKLVHRTIRLHKADNTKPCK